MGTYLNPNKAAFQMAVNSEIFVDKTVMIQYLNSIINTQQRFVSVSRPRRFGKTMAADMICAYYDRKADSRSLFEERKISNEADWDKYLMKYDVIRLVMTKFFKRDIAVKDSLNQMQRLVIRDIKKVYPEADYFDDTNLIQTIEDVYADKQLVFVIDEWDAVFRVRQADKDGHTQYLDFLRDLLKDDAHIALAYMTGILPIKKYGEHSALNMFYEYSMIAPLQLAKYTGFTQDEVKGLCEEYGRDFANIRDWYDGYEVSDIIPKNSSDKAARYAIYNPLSVVKAVSTGKISNYWTKTETYEALAEYIKKDYAGLQETVAILMNGGRIKISTSSYQNDMTTFNSKDDILTLLIHLGYLGYDDETGEVFIPNKEILDEFKTSTESPEWVKAFKKLLDDSHEILEAIWALDEEKVASLLEKAHDEVENKTYNNEAALNYAVQLALYAAKIYYTVLLELDSGKGYIDIAYLPIPKYPNLPALVIELKHDKTAETALTQIKKQQYPARLEHYKGNILLVGIEYDKEVANTSPKFKHHKCKIERA